MGQNEYYKPTPNEEMVASYMGRIYALGEWAGRWLAQDMAGYERKVVYIEDGRFTILLSYSHTPGKSNFQIGGLVVGASNAYEVAYALPIIKPEQFDSAFEIGYHAPDNEPEKPFMVDFSLRQAQSSRFLSVPAAGAEQLSFESAAGWPIGQMNVRYLLNGTGAATVTQSAWGQEFDKTATPLGVSVVAHVVNGLEAVLGKTGKT